MRIIGALLDSGGDADMTLTDTSNGKITKQQLIHAASIFLFLLVISFAAVLVKAYFNGEFRSVDALQKHIGKYGAFGPVFLTVFQAIQVVIPVLPGFLGCAAGSVMFGPAVGFWCNYIGIGGGSIIAFLPIKSSVNFL